MMDDKTVILGVIDITAFLKAEQLLVRVLAEPKTDITRDAAIQRFEYTFELAWKTVKRILREKGLVANSPRDVFRLAATVQLIDNVDIWFGFLNDRNSTVHIYNESVADTIYSHLPSFQQHIEKLRQTIQAL